MTGTPPYDIELVQILEAPRERVYRAFTAADEFARWYGPPGFPVHRETVDVDARLGGLQRFTMVGEANPSMRTAFHSRFTDVVPNQLLASSGEWVGIPGVDGPWPSQVRVEFHDVDDGTRLVLREGPHPPGTADLGRQAWQAMFGQLASTLTA